MIQHWWCRNVIPYNNIRLLSYVEGLMQRSHNSIANTQEFRLFHYPIEVLCIATIPLGCVVILKVSRFCSCSCQSHTPFGLTYLLPQWIPQWHPPFFFNHSLTLSPLHSPFSHRHPLSLSHPLTLNHQCMLIHSPIHPLVHTLAHLLIIWLTQPLIHAHWTIHWLPGLHQMSMHMLIIRFRCGWFTIWCAWPLENPQHNTKLASTAHPSYSRRAIGDFHSTNWLT